MLVAANSALQAALAPLCAQADALMTARAAYTDAPAGDIALVVDVRLGLSACAIHTPPLG